MDGCGERPRKGKFDLEAFTCACADHVIIVSTNTCTNMYADKTTDAVSLHNLLCKIKHGINIIMHTEDMRL